MGYETIVFVHTYTVTHQLYVYVDTEYTTEQVSSKLIT